MEYLCQVPRIYDGLEYLLDHDPVFSALDITSAEFTRPYFGPGFPGLVRIVLGQQVSTQAADSLWQKFIQGVPAITPDTVLLLNADEMRALGLSHQKARYIHGLAQAIKDKSFDPLALEHLSDEEIYREITALKGFGNWSAEMFLMFGLARPDVWPAGDLGIQEGLRIYLGLTGRPDLARTEKEGARFAPYRTAASLLLWYLKAR
ncbi:MAG: DNA-3-methyladenine glycosylase 2 family protein [Rhodospirillales bacterium]|nr:DNA-3-methyladenine glycosylase 2 family protein [Rhodospirillales bacterium]MCB9996633.1 DNA-3-methyladenine glycosylase 2 family protein [Rhodospirillales bacterium]